MKKTRKLTKKAKNLSNKGKVITKPKLSVKPTKGLLSQLKSGADKIAEQIEAVFVSPKDVVDAIKKDHDSLRNYLGVLKDTDKPMDERRAAYAAFSALLKSHTTSEENAVYKNALLLTGREMQIKLAEGFVEHQLADDLMARIEKTKEAMAWSAHANVLSEIVEHHLKEEERDLLPLIRKNATVSDNMEMLAEFLSLRGKTQKKVSHKNAGVLKAVAQGRA